MTAIAVIGPGAIGGAVAAWLAQKPAFDVTVCARTPFPDLRVETPDGMIVASPRIVTRPDDAAPVDWVLIASKAYDASSMAPWLQRLVAERTRVAVLQNGVEHRERFAHLVAAERILPVVINIPGSRPAPGRIVQHRYGKLTVPPGEDGDAFSALFAHSKISVSISEDFRSRLWEKLCLNSVGAVSTLTLGETAAAWTPELEKLVRALVEECAAVARAEGAVIEQALIEQVVDGARKPRQSEHLNSMHADRVAGRPMEVDARNGAIVRFGKKHGVPTPANDVIVTLLHACAGSQSRREKD